MCVGSGGGGAGSMGGGVNGRRGQVNTYVQVMWEEYDKDIVGPAT